ncbi:CvpA family protein [Oscillibacter ruminantium]|uniref:CvpA family protein n=1 Tax=Oscillibacter ruminantium TaxID=1263547 RepID=UPI0033288183
MQTAVIIDCIVAAVLLGFLIYGAWRGLFRAVAGLLMVILALTGAMFVARELTPIATNLLRPVIENTVTQRVDDAMNGSAPSQGGEETVVPMQPEISPPSSEASSPSGSASAADSSGALGDSGAQTRLQAGELLKLMGWDDTLTKSLSDRAEEKVRDTGVSLAMAVVDSVMESFVYMVLFALSFAVLSLLLHLVARALDIAMKLPGVHLLNGLGGAVVGLIQGVLLIFLAIWLLRCLRVSFDTEIVAQTRLLSFFTSHSPLDLLFY